MADSSKYSLPKTLVNNQADKWSETALVALRIIEMYNKRPLLMEKERKHLDTLWEIVNLTTYPPKVITKVSDLLLDDLDTKKKATRRRKV